MVNRITAKFFVIVEKCMKTLSKTFEIGIGLLVFSTVISENEKKTLRTWFGDSFYSVFILG